MCLDALISQRDESRMHIEDVAYAYRDLSLRGYWVHPEVAAAPLPGVLVVHDAGGLGEHAKEHARMLADLGYAAFALDLYGNGQTVSDGMRRIRELGGDIPTWRGLASAGLTVLAERPEVDASRLAAIGYCFGGTTVYELARTGADLKAVVGFHSGLSPSSGEAKNIKAKVLTLIGADDPLIPPEARLAFEKEMREAKVDWQMSIYGNTGHAFTNKRSTALNIPGFAYQPDSDARSWAEMRRLFDEVFAEPE